MRSSCITIWATKGTEEETGKLAISTVLNHVKLYLFIKHILYECVRINLLQDKKAKKKTKLDDT